MSQMLMKVHVSVHTINHGSMKVESKIAQLTIKLKRMARWVVRHCKGRVDRCQLSRASDGGSGSSTHTSISFGIPGLLGDLVLLSLGRIEDVCQSQ